MAIKMPTDITDYADQHPLTREHRTDTDVLAKVSGCMVCATGYVMDEARGVCVECSSPPCCLNNC